jgi:hypothetical protein
VTISGSVVPASDLPAADRPSSSHGGRRDGFHHCRGGPDHCVGPVADAKPLETPTLGHRMLHGMASAAAYIILSCGALMALYIHPAIDIEIESAHMLQPRIFCMRPRLEICSVCVIFQ